MDSAAIFLIVALSIQLSWLCWRVSVSYRPLLAREAEVPIQWMIGGEVTKTTSPRFALSFIPALTAGIMIFGLGLAFAAPSGDRWAFIPVQLVLGLIMIAGNAFLLSRAARR